MSTITPDVERSTREELGSGKRVPGEIGVWIFVLADLVIFGILFAAVLVMRGDDPAVFAEGREHLSQGLGLLNTLILLTSSMFVVLGVDAAREGRGSTARALFAAGVACGLAFIGVKAIEWGGHLSDGFTAHSNDFYMMFYVTTGVHLLHVVIGMAGLLGVRAMVRNGIDPQRRALVESGGIYWHMVDLLWLVIYALFYLAV